ncbi:MAG TPA: Hint domain-containing protein [Bdellovibrionales bacterium]|nr:Hint domain-containing protein [Bdellovibrionales bacterium]
MIRSNVSEPGSAILCQRNQTGQANDRDAAAPGAGNDPDLTRFRYCAIGLANKDGTQNLTSTLYYPRKSFPPASPSATLPPVTGSLAGSFNPPCSIPFDDPSLQDGTGVCKEIFYNKPALIDLTWNDLPDGDYELRTIAMDASGNVSNDYFVHRFKVAVPNPNWESCPHSSTLCPGQTTVRPNPNDTACGYNFTCDGTKPCCPPPELRCPAGSPCYASNSCPGGAYDGTPQCPGCTGTCPTSSGTRAGQGCPDRNTYSACQVKLDDCGNACPAGLMDPNSICPANNCGALNACGAACPITGTACGCPPAGTLCTNQTKVKDARGINCPGTLPAPGCPAPKAGEVACGTVAMSCDPTDPGAIANSCTKWCTVAPPTPTPTPTPAPTCVREEVWKHSPNGGFEGGDVTNSGCPAPESYGTGPERAPAGPWEFPDHTNFEFYVDAWCAYGDCELSFNGSTLCTHNGPAFGSRNSFNPNLWGQDVSTWGRSGPSPNNGMCDTWCRINVGLMADRCTGGGGGGATPPPTAPPTCNGTCDINIQNQTCTGRMASDSCGNPVCPGNRICSCTPTCTGSRSSQYCSGVPTGESDGCGGTCRGDYDCAGCSCDPAVAANTCVGTPIANRCGRMGPPTNCQGTKQPGCENGVPVCGGTCAAPPTPSCQNECVNSWDCGSAPMCDPYSECSIDRYACVTQPSGCNQCVWQQFCPTCRPYDNYGCFTAGALIDTPRGAIPIEQIKIGDEVYSYDNLLKTRVRGRVERVFTHDVEIFGIVELEDGTKFEVTAEHKFYLPELELYEAAGKLKPGDKLLRDNGAGELYVEVKSVDFSNAERRAKVYNFHVPYFQNYYVNGVLVHNIKMRDVDYQYY